MFKTEHIDFYTKVRNKIFAPLMIPKMHMLNAE